MTPPSREVKEGVKPTPKPRGYFFISIFISNLKLDFTHMGLKRGF